MSEEVPRSDVVELSSVKYLTGCLVLAAFILLIGRNVSIPTWILGLEVFLTIIALFVFGSIRYRLDKNALTYGAVIVVAATFWHKWWQASALRVSFQQEGWAAAGRFLAHYGLTLHGLDQLVHADTMLFILGLTFFVAVIAQTRLLESASFAILTRSRGNVLVTVGILTAIVSLASGILDGVSMIGLMIRTMVIILLLSKTNGAAVIYAVIVSTITTTVCGMWLAYGEPPNLIMKANLEPHLTDGFFLRYCLPVAVGSYFIVLWNLRRHLRGRKVKIQELDVLDQQTADVRFIQASRHGEVLTPIAFTEEHENDLGPQAAAVIKRLHHGEPMGAALVNEGIPEKTRQKLLGKFVSEALANVLDEHYVAVEKHKKEPVESIHKIRAALADARQRRLRAQRIGAVSFIPFIGFLAWHAIDHRIPLFWASFAGFATALVGIAAIPKMRNLALREAKHEYMEYLFLLPLFLSITLLQKSGFFSQIATALAAGIERFGASHIAYLQFLGATVLSAMLDNNVVADFAGRAIQGLPVNIIHLFAMAQIAGYAAGGCWTHIGSAQSVVAYSFVRKEVDEHYTPFQWIKAMTPIILEICLFMTVVVYVEGWLLSK